MHTQGHCSICRSGTAEKESTGPSSRMATRQPPAVPFLWEERPGIAKKNWKPGGPSMTQLLIIPPVKLIVSVPFDWEEKPGKPLSCFSQPEVDTANSLPSETGTMTQLSLMYTEEYHNNLDKVDAYLKEDGAYKQQSLPDNNQDFAADQQRGIFDLDIESFRFETEGSYGSQPSLMANCLVSSEEVSYAIPMPKTLPATDMDQFETPSSPSSKSDSSTSSYATGVSSFVGASFLEYLFPSHPPKSAILHKGAYSMKGSLPPSELDCPNVKHESERNNSIIIRRPTTLGELIMLSRKRSCQRRASQMRKQGSSVELVIKKAFRCCIFGTSTPMIEELHRRKQQLMLKPI